MRLIDADELVDDFRNYCRDCSVRPHPGRCIRCAIGQVIDKIDNSPSINAAAEEKENSFMR